MPPPLGSPHRENHIILLYLTHTHQLNLAPSCHMFLACFFFVLFVRLDSFCCRFTSSFMDSLHSTGARARGGAKAASDFEPHVIHPWKPHGWRTLAKLATRPVSKWRGVELGLYSAGSHNVIGIPDCRVHHPSVNLAVKTLQESTKRVRSVVCFAEGGGCGVLTLCMPLLLDHAFSRGGGAVFSAMRSLPPDLETLALIGCSLLAKMVSGSTRLVALLHITPLYNGLGECQVSLVLLQPTSSSYRHA